MRIRNPDNSTAKLYISPLFCIFVGHFPPPLPCQNQCGSRSETLVYILPLTLQERPAAADPERWEPFHLAAVGAGDGRTQPRDDQLHLLRLQLLLLMHQLRLLALPLRLVCRRYEWLLLFYFCGQFLFGSPVLLIRIWSRIRNKSFGSGHSPFCCIWYDHTTVIQGLAWSYLYLWGKYVTGSAV